MEHIIALGIYNSTDLHLINQVRFHYKCYSYTDIFNITGDMLRPSFLSTAIPPLPSNFTTWPRTNPSSHAFNLWREAIQ